jgi:hypothetical protein
MNWKDTTKYRYNQDVKIPTSFSLEIGIIKAVITCKHIFYPGGWVMHCKELDLDTYPIGVSDTEEVEYVQEVATIIIENMISDKIEAYQEIIKVLDDEGTV